MFKIILGILILTLSLGMAAAGWAVAVYGNYSAVVNIFMGSALMFFGLGCSLSGIMLIRGYMVREALGGAITALLGHRGVGMRYSNDRMQNAGAYRARFDRVKTILYNILLYSIVGVAVLFLGILSVGKVVPIEKVLRLF